MNKTQLDTLFWYIQRENMTRHGSDAAERYMMPLKWYINTGRASCDFLQCLYNARPVLIARDLAKGGSDEEAINRICKRIKYNREGM